jgi:hypothetical protein
VISETFPTTPKAATRLVEAARLEPGYAWETTLQNRTLGLEISVSISVRKLRGKHE